ncbi:Pentatricopeptide repeat-containing protein [Dichanthelium oligosanthes]|uniref:Pentatricopeptide repeat-containing protein n=1 Tax=Dichanthelium oligosanthes TaxID=888268 RepID=A0A1E5VRQ6_9POAL|nr:Pentatricopeptide repeat-containing protein [Dichanthelium oligosanthes]
MPRGRRGLLAPLFRATSTAVRRHHPHHHHPCALHPLLLKSGRASHTHLATRLAVAYADSGRLLPDARRVFDETPRRDLVLCNAMVACYARHGLALHAWSLVASMRRSGTPGLAGDGFTFSALLRPPRRRPDDDDAELLLLLRLGALAHGLVLRMGHLADVVVATALLDMYAKYGRVADARRVFDAMVLRNVVTWNAIIVCYGCNGEGKDAVELFRQMLRDGCCCWPDERTLASVLSSCANMAAANEATQVHAYTQKRGLQGFLQVANALIMAYGKNGFVGEVTRMFAMTDNPDIVTWSSMVSSYAYLGHAKDAIHVFERMLQQGAHPDGISFLGVLSACSHAGLIEDGLHYFLMMTRGYRIDPSPQHLACLVDLLGRAGRIEDAYNVVVKLSCESNADIVGAFLGACKMRGNVELAKWATDKLLCLEPSEAVNYLLMSNAFAAAGAWNELAKIVICSILRAYQCDHSHVLAEMTDVGINRRVECAGHIDAMGSVLEYVHNISSEDTDELHCQLSIVFFSDISP